MCREMSFTLAPEPDWQCSSMGGKRYQTRAKRWQWREGRRWNSSSKAPVIWLKCQSSLSSLFFSLSQSGLFVPLAPSRDPGSLSPTSVAPQSVRNHIYPQVQSVCSITFSLKEFHFSAVKLSEAGMHSVNRKFSQKGASAGSSVLLALGDICMFQFCLTEESQISPSLSFTGSHPVLLWGWVVQIVKRRCPVGFRLEVLPRLILGFRGGEVVF